MNAIALVQARIDPAEPERHDAWRRAKVQEALNDPRPDIPHDEVEAHFARRREAARHKVGHGEG